MKKTLQTLVLTSFLALAAPAWALGLGQIKLKSGPGQPLLAEIPVVSADPEELTRLKATLASPETFLRVGLPLPDSLVSDLQFALAQDGEGKPVIRVTSPGPVAIPMLTFLLEVDWGSGRLVREYSVLVAAPETVEAAAVPDIEAAEGRLSETIVRESTAVADALPAPVPAEAGEPAGLPANPAMPPQPAAASATAQALPPVQRGQTLSGIAAQLKQPGQDLQTVMAALLLSNPQAFINGNPNRLREGAVLQLPAEGPLAGGAASAEVSALAAQLGQWRSRSGRRNRAVDVASAAPAESGRRAAGQPLPRRRADARLEITPPAATAADGVTRSGSGGQGDASMAQQLQEARETIAARDAEVAELKSRVEELEKLKQQQSQLIQMKDGELAQVQQQLQAQQSNKSEGGGSGLFAGLIGALLMALAAGLFWRWQGKRKKPVQRRDAPSFASAAVLPVATEEMEDDTAAVPAELDAPSAAHSDDYLHVPESVASAASGAKNNAQEVPNLWVTPSWVGSPPQSWEGRQVEQDPLQLRPLTDDPARVGAWQFPEDGGQAEGAAGFASEARAVLPDAVPAIAVEAESGEVLPESGIEDGRLTLARTYIELGDEATARLLLQQVVDEGEPVQSSHAQLLLDNLAG